MCSFAPEDYYPSLGREMLPMVEVVLVAVPVELGWRVVVVQKQPVASVSIPTQELHYRLQEPWLCRAEKHPPTEIVLSASMVVGVATVVLH